MDIPPEIIISAERLALTGSTAVIYRPFRAGRLVRLRRGYYVKTSTWVEATPAQRFEWSAAAVGLAFEQSVFCGESAAVVLGVPTLHPPEFVDLATSTERTTGRRPATFVVHGKSVLAEKARNTGNHPMRYVLRRDAEAVVSGRFSCTSPVQTAMDVMCTSSFSRALVVADGIARMLVEQGSLGQDACLIEHPEIALALDGIVADATKHRAVRIASLANAKADSVGESYSRAVIELLGFEQPLQHHTDDSDQFVARTGFWWPEHLIAGEFEGGQQEKPGEESIRALGITVVRWNWADLEQPGLLRQKLLRAGLRPRARASS
ncbi:hypothetical protein BMF89_10305 [Arthrobacter sp. SRS-W-1-2016]|uniref:hypothetical protein n=1 Tax=Arthrobacter sp. SRS-W-1-2016 TaxID=1930254 RepID=UPI0009913049|nr:hypothetical protein [Arthrobacter sp. SRS-W-1-2016]OOP62041.1 hypothetical protein BMF89_10305 [Arthrobacter sp. SRS-W-1-2016]